MKRDRFVDLAERIAGAISGGAELVFVFAPTGYGKTMASPYLLKALRDRGLASRLVHVVPTRALLRQAYADKFAPAGEKLGFTTAYQSHDMIPESTKSPYFLADLTVTTLESFLLNAYKLQPAELSKLIEGSSHGHYYPAVTALSSSVVVFDEAHIYVGDSSEKSTAMLVAAAMGALLKLGVPCVIETATMPTALLESLRRALSISRGGSRAKAIYLCPEGGDCAQVRALSEIGVSVEKVEPVDWRENPERWATRLASREEALEEVRQKCGEKLVLYVSNSVERAVELYEKLRDECDSTLVHARLSEADREKAESELREKERGLVVGSPVIEVGVDVDAQVLVTEPAPLENIAQRAGRLCRKRECREAELILVDDEELIGPYDHASAKRALEELRRVA
ncbi:MAG: CRISPR-associated helicase Cas3', partial [Acidilobaceae archaeon]